MADQEKIKISELAASNSYSGAYAAGVDSGGTTKKFPLSPLSDIDNKVDKVAGKGLSTNDYTDEDKEKIESLQIISNTEIDALFT